MHSWRTGRLRGPLTALALVGAYWACDILSLFVVQDLDRLPSFWAADSFLILALLMLSGRWRMIAAAGCLTGSAVLSYIHTPLLPLALGVTAASGVLSFLAAWLIRKFRVVQVRNLKQAGKLLVMVILPITLLGASTLGAMLHFGYGLPFWKLASHWFMAAFMGASMVLPALLLLTARGNGRALARGRVELIVIGAVVLAMTAAAWTPGYMLPLILAFPAATIFALRLGGRGAALSVLLITLVAFVYPFANPSANQLAKSAAETNADILGFQIYIVVVFYNALATALATDHQGRIKRQMERRTAIARAARARALKASQAKSEFLAAMSHELRTPLNGVLGFSQMVLNRPGLSPDVRREVELIGKSGDALLTIINDILDYSGIESGQVALNAGPLDLASLAGDVVGMTSLQAAAKGLALTVEAPRDGRLWSLDEARLRQVLLNLLNNAIKFTHEGGASLKITLTGGFARFEVTDTGIGIAEDRQHILFDDFVQLDAGRARAYDGAGLGLAICRRLVGMMGGEIGLRSQVGHGSTFWFLIPLEAWEAQSAEMAEDKDEDEGRPLHVLVVDDHPVNRQLAITMLELLGCTSDAAENGAEAVEAVKAGRFDAVLMDVHMPVMDGLAATRAIRSLGDEKGALPIIGLSADVMPNSVETGLAAGMNDYLGKPANLAQLQASLAECLDKIAA